MGSGTKVQPGKRGKIPFHHCGTAGREAMTGEVETGVARASQPGDPEGGEVRLLNERITMLSITLSNLEGKHIRIISGREDNIIMVDMMHPQDNTHPDAHVLDINQEEKWVQVYGYQHCEVKIQEIE